MGEGPDHAAGVVVQEAVQARESARAVVVQPQGVLHGGDQALPFAVVGERAGRDQGEAAGDLGAPCPGQKAGFGDVDAGIDEGGGQALGEVLESVRDFGAVAAGE